MAKLPDFSWKNSKKVSRELSNELSKQINGKVSWEDPHIFTRVGKKMKTIQIEGEIGLYNKKLITENVC